MSEKSFVGKLVLLLLLLFVFGITIPNTPAQGNAASCKSTTPAAIKKEILDKIAADARFNRPCTHNKPGQKIWEKEKDHILVFCSEKKEVFLRGFVISLDKDGKPSSAQSASDIKDVESLARAVKCVKKVKNFLITTTPTGCGRNQDDCGGGICAAKGQC